MGATAVVGVVVVVLDVVVGTVVADSGFYKESEWKINNHKTLTHTRTHTHTHTHMHTPLIFSRLQQLSGL